MIDYEGTTITVGARIELHPATDLWMMGARFGTVEKIGRAKVTVKLDRLPNRRTPITFYPTHIRVL